MSSPGSRDGLCLTPRGSEPRGICRRGGIVPAAMTGIAIVPFADEHLDLAARLLAERYARHRAVEPLLPDITDFREQVEREWRTDGASGAIALDGDEGVGYLIGQR